jgi:protein-tyrosine phosphatase
VTGPERWSGVELPGGVVVRGRGRRQPPPHGPEPTFGLCLGRDRGDHRPGWPLEWVDWPDFGVPRDSAAADDAVRRAYALAAAGERVEVTCGGGTGRTGTVLACFAVLAGVPAADAVGWVRAHYRRRAVETPAQRRWVAAFAARTSR